MSHLKFDAANVMNSFVTQEELKNIQPQVSLAHKQIVERSGPGNEYLGWLDWPEEYDKEEYSRIKDAATKIQADSEVFIVIGIGGSYLGAKAALHFLNHTFYNELPADQRKAPQIFFAGNSISGTYIQELIEFIGEKDFSINVISKSGTTTETSIAFRIFKEILYKKYDAEEAASRIYATTDSSEGALRQEASEKGYESFIIPDDIGGRFTVLTAVGLLPIAVSGVNIDDLMQGARDAMTEYSDAALDKNEAYQYAALRNILYRKGYTIEMLVNYEPSLSYFAEWWKQLFGESEGKDQKGIFPASADFSTDLHSMGQYIQDGRRQLFETVLKIEEPRASYDIPYEDENLDELNYIASKDMNEVNEKAYQGTLLAHLDGGVPNFILNLPDMTPYTLGHLIYFFEAAVAVSGYLNAVNPFNQPGVEAYKENMFALLGKPGYEKLSKELKSRLNEG